MSVALDRRELESAISALDRDRSVVYVTCNSAYPLINVSSFAANIRKLVYSLWRSLNASNNVLVSTALRSDLLVSSPVFRRWRNVLF